MRMFYPTNLKQSVWTYSRICNIFYEHRNLVIKTMEGGDIRQMSKIVPKVLNNVILLFIGLITLDTIIKFDWLVH